MPMQKLVKYAKIEADRLNFIRYNQNQLRAEVYSKVVDSMYSGESDAANIGQRVILPSTFQGSPRNMMQRYQDAMTIVRNIGNPDYFVTMTTNPDWVEIKRELRPGQTASERPDIVVRVFKLKPSVALTISIGNLSKSEPITTHFFKFN